VIFLPILTLACILSERQNLEFWSHVFARPEVRHIPKDIDIANGSTMEGRINQFTRYAKRL
jgi:hypothetical protein